MTIVSYYSTIAGEVAPSNGAADNTSSQIHLSRSVAGPPDYHGSCHPETPTLPQDYSTSRKLPCNIRVINKSEDDDMIRGRSTQRVLKHPNPLAKAESRPRFQSDAAVEVDMRPIRRHTQCRSNSLSQFADPASCVVREDNLLEPFPYIQVRSTVTEVLNDSPNYTTAYNAAESSTKVALNDALNNTNIKPQSSYCVNCSRDSSPLQSTLIHQSGSADSSLQLGGNIESMGIGTSATASKANTSIVPSEGSSASVSLGAQLPTEILQQVFRLLTPTDFNSSRHICRAWFISSLEPSILKLMLKRGGWSSCMEHCFGRNQSLESGSRINDAWIMSKHIARECTLGPDWTGNGASGGNAQDASSKKSGFVHISNVDFTEVPVPRSETDTAGIIFTVSTCGKFLVAANGCLIYVYELNRSHTQKESSAICPGSLRPVTSVICPRRVLACSMDTSSRRYAIAVLLDGRVGLVCDITPSHIVPGAAPTGDNDYSGHTVTSGHSAVSADEFQGAEGSQRQLYTDSSPFNFGSNHIAKEPRFIFRGVATAVTSAPNEYAWHGSVRRYVPEYDDANAETCRNSVTTSMPIEMGPRSLYRNLCSDDDPPRSVAICPQRRCVAFGCSAGIELHWVDALTGQDLNRWFPLTAPSDYLFFLPPRTGIDSAKKLRLISSAARPGETAAISQRIVGATTRNSPFWGKLLYEEEVRESDAEGSCDQRFIARHRANSRNRLFAGRVDCSDHYRAVPLNDGYHVLFTDPATGLLCLGSDAPVGGATKLLRKIWFQGPGGKGCPVAYAGSMDPASGVRVVAAYGSSSEQSVWFFSVPSDVFAANRGLPFVQGGSYVQAWSRGAGHDNRNANWVDWWPDKGLYEWLDNIQDSIPGAFPRTIWPVKIRGQEIGTCPVLVDIAVYSGPSMIVWAFSRNGLARAWRINDGNNTNVRNMWVTRDGTVCEFDEEGDLDMSNAPSPTPDALYARSVPFRQESFDGTVSSNLANTLAAISDQQMPVIESEGQSYRCDSDGDVIMEDLNSPDLSPVHGYQARPQESVEAVAFLYHREGNLYRSSRRSGHSYESIGSDFVEALTGVTRIDVEIR